MSAMKKGGHMISRDERVKFQDNQSASSGRSSVSANKNSARLLAAMQNVDIEEGPKEYNVDLKREESQPDIEELMKKIN